MTNVASWTDLQSIDNDLTDDYVLTRNLLTTDDDYVGIGDSWTPLGTLTGSLNGQYFRIMGLISSVNSDEAGLFSMNSGTIQNLLVLGADIDQTGAGDYPAGIICGINSGTVTRCITSGTVDNAGNLAGGLIGHHTTGGDTSDCSSSATVTGNDAVGGCSGGVKGANPFVRCFAYGNVSGNDAVGGCVGRISSSATIEDCYAGGDVSASGDGTAGGVGGLVGFVNLGTVNGGYGSGTVTDSGGAPAGGCIGSAEFAEFYSCYGTGTTTGIGDVGYFGGNIFATYDTVAGYTGGATDAIGYDFWEGAAVNRLTDPDPDYGIDYDTLSDLYDNSADVYDTGTFTWDFTTPIWFELRTNLPRLQFPHTTDGVEDYDRIKVDGVSRFDIKSINGISSQL